MVSHLGHVTMTSFPVVRLNLRNRDPLVWSFLAKPCWDTLCSHACNLMWKDLASFLWISRTFLNSKYFAYLHTIIQLPNSDTPSNLQWWAPHSNVFATKTPTFLFFIQKVLTERCFFHLSKAKLTLNSPSKIVSKMHQIVLLRTYTCIVGPALFSPLWTQIRDSVIFIALFKSI